MTHRTCGSYAAVRRNGGCTLRAIARDADVSGHWGGAWHGIERAHVWHGLQLEAHFMQKQLALHACERVCV